MVSVFWLVNKSGPVTLLQSGEHDAALQNVSNSAPVPEALGVTDALFPIAIPPLPSTTMLGTVVPREFWTASLTLLAVLRLPVIHTLPFTLAVQLFGSETLPVIF